MADGRRNLWPRKQRRRRRPPLPPPSPSPSPLPRSFRDGGRAMQLCHVRREHFQLGVVCGRPWALVQHARGGAAWRGAEMVVRNGVLGLRWQDSRHLEVGDRDIALRRSHLAHLMRTDGLATHRPAVHHHHLHLRDVWREDERGRGGGRGAGRGACVVSEPRETAPPSQQAGSGRGLRRGLPHAPPGRVRPLPRPPCPSTA